MRVKFEVQHVRSKCSTEKTGLVIPIYCRLPSNYWYSLIIPWFLGPTAFERDGCAEVKKGNMQEACHVIILSPTFIRLKDHLPNKHAKFPCSSFHQLKTPECPGNIPVKKSKRTHRLGFWVQCWTSRQLAASRVSLHLQKLTMFSSEKGSFWKEFSYVHWIYLVFMRKIHPNMKIFINSPLNLLHGFSLYMELGIQQTDKVTKVWRQSVSMSSLRMLGTRYCECPTI